MSSLEVTLGMCTIVFPIVGLIIGYYASKSKMEKFFLTKDYCTHCHSKVQVINLAIKLDDFLKSWEEKEDIIVRLQIEVAVVKEKLSQMDG